MVTKNWLTTNDDWTTAAAWTPNGQPMAGDDVVIPDASSDTISVTGPSITSDVGSVGSVVNGDVRLLSLNRSGVLSASVLQNSGFLNDSGRLTIGSFENSGRATFSGGTNTTVQSIVNSGTVESQAGSIDASNFSNSGTYRASGGGTLSVSGTLTNTGNVSIDPSSGNPISITAGTLSNDGSILLSTDFQGRTASFAVAGNTTGSGSFTLVTGGSNQSARLEFGGSSTNNIMIQDQRDQVGSYIQFDNPAAGYSGRISGFTKFDVLDLKESISSYSYDGATLIVNPSNGGASQSFALSGDVSGLNASPDGSGGTQFSAVCYASGTRIRILRAGDTVDAAVETLRAGDIAVTASGEHRPIRWIGHRNLDSSRHARPEAVWPIRVLAGAFGERLPQRDLWLSPDHSVRVSVLDEVLIPIKHLINDATIAQVETETVTYWHVELDSHDILLAEGLPAESFLDTGVREFFENEGAFTVLHPDFSPLSLGDFCLPLVQDGPIIDAVRTRLLARAAAMGWSLTAEDGLHLLADGIVIRPERDGATARFTIPQDTVEARLISRSFVPERVRVGAGDGRRLGVALRGLSVVDSSGVVRSLPINHSLLSDGYSFVQIHENDAWRWTNGDACIPSALWAGAATDVTLCVETAPDRGTLQAWEAPSPACTGSDGLAGWLQSDLPGEKAFA